MTVGVVVRPDQVTLGVLVDAVPRDAVDDAVAVCGVREGPTRSANGPWRNGCTHGCAPMSCSPRTAGSTHGRPGTPPPRPVPRCCGGHRPNSCCPCCGCCP